MSIIASFFLWLTDNERSKECKGKYEEKFFDLSYRFQHHIGMSPVDSTWSYKVYRSIIMTFVVSVILGEFYRLAYEMDVDVIIDSISVTIIHLMCVYRYVAMTINLETYTKICRAMESPTFDVDTEGRKKLMDVWAKRNRRFFLVLLVTGTCTLAVWYIYPLLDEVEYNMPVLVRLPYNHRSKERYPWTYAIVLLAFHYISYFVVTNDLISVCVLVHLACQFSLLSDCFRNLSRDSKAVATESGAMTPPLPVRVVIPADILAPASPAHDEAPEPNQQPAGVVAAASALGRSSDSRAELFVDRSVDVDESWRAAYFDKLYKYIRQHQLLLHNATALKRVLSGPMLGQLLGSGMLICFIAYQVTATASVNKAKFLMTIWYLAYTLLELYILCLWCNEINIQSERVGEAVYCCGWEQGTGGSLHAAKLLQIVMLRSRRPVVMTAGGIYDLSLESYKTLVKTSYSALTVLLRMRRK